MLIKYLANCPATFLSVEVPQGKSRSVHNSDPVRRKALHSKAEGDFTSLFGAPMHQGTSNGERAIALDRRSVGDEQPDRSVASSALSTSQWLTVADVLAELNIVRGTWEKWRQRGVGPRAVRLPNGQLRIQRTVLDRWLMSLPGSL